MTREQLFEAIGEIDDGLLIEPKKKGRIPARVIAACAAMFAVAVVGVGVVRWMHTGVDLPFVSSEDIGTETLDDSMGCYVDMVNLYGITYEAINTPYGVEPGELLATVNTPLIGFTGEYDGSFVGATLLDEGDSIYAWGDYSTDYRIVGITSDGVIRCYERTNLLGKSLTVPFDEIFPAELAKRVIITDNLPCVLGEIDDPDEVKSLADSLLAGCEWTEKPESAVTPTYRLRFVLEDGSETELLVRGDMGYWLGMYITLPEGLAETIAGHVIYEDVSNSLDAGGLYCSSDFDRRRAYETPEPPYEFLMPMFIDSEGLHMGWIYTGDHTLLADDAVRSVHHEGAEIWYLTESGNAAHMVMNFPDDMRALKKIISEGGTFDEYLTREILYEGDFIDLQVLNGVVWALDESGKLYRNGEFVAEGVSCFALDAQGVTVGGKTLRRIDNDGGEIVLSKRPAQAVAACGAAVVYASGDEVRQVRIDGNGDRLLAELTVTEIASARLETDYMLALLGEDGQAYVYGGGKSLFRIAEDVSDIDMTESYDIVLLHTDGSAEYYECFYNTADDQLMHYQKSGDIFLDPIH
ncbi:MAG: hypothetical protein IJ493_01925 [Clostridia bacterium]|nr:hypothetical protein [Clostridia bacterium]